MMKTGPIFSREDNPVSFSSNFKTRFLSYLYLPCFNLWLVLYPWRLSHDWQFESVPPITEWTDVRNLASLSMIVILCTLTLKGLHKKTKEGRAILWSVAVMICSFVPASNIFFRVGFVVAERILYTPSFGSCLILGLGFVKIVKFLNYHPVKFYNFGNKIFQLLLLLTLILLTARTLRRNMDWFSRETLLKSGLRAVPHNAKMHYNYANLCKDSGSPSTAIQYYAEAIRLWPDYVSAHNNLGTVYVQVGEHQKAEDHFKLALTFHPGHLHATENLALYYRRKNRTEDSISVLRKVIHFKLGTSNRYTHFGGTTADDVIRLGLLLASIYSDADRTREEEEVYLILTAEYPMKADVHTDYGHFLVKQNQYNKAVRHFEAALSLEPTHEQALPSYVSLIDPHFQNNETHILYKKALESEWNSDMATSLGKAYLNEGNLQEAENIFLKVLHFHPNHIEATVHLGQVRLQQKKYSVSEELLKEALKISPNNREALYHLSVLLATTNRSFESINTAKIAADGCSQPTPFCAALHTHLADLMHTNAMVEHAIQNYQIALNLHPFLVQALLNLGAIYHLQGNYSNAWQYYNKALELEPSNRVIQENIWKLQRIFQGSETLLDL